MAELFLKFAIRLEDTSEPEVLHNYGPEFHRWLPDGETDSLKLKTGHPKIDLEVWHDRRGFVEFNEIRFDYNRREVDTALMAKQGVLQAGPLFGRLVFRDPPSPALNAIREFKTGDPEYVALAKLVVIQILYPILSKLIDTFRINFGQHWIPPMKPWDSRENTLGAYCKRMSIQWSLDGGVSWSPFVPDEPVFYESLTVELDSHYREYITKQDWQSLPNLIRERSEPSLAELYLDRAHRFMDIGETRIALIDAVTSLELAIEEFVQRSPSWSNTIIHDMDAFWEMPLKARMITLALALGKHPPDRLEKAVNAIDLRNKTIHKGQNLSKDVSAKLSSLLNIIISFLPAPFYRFPSRHSGNAWAEPEEWNKIYMKHGFSQLE